MKKFRLSMIMAVFAFIAMLPLKASAEETKEIGVTCTPNGSKTGYTVDLYIPNAAKEEISTIGLKLDVTPNPDVSSTGYESMIDFSGDVKARAKVYEYRSGNTLNIYIAGTKALFNEDDTLTVGTVSMKNSADKLLELSEVKLADADDAIQVVRGWGNAESPNRETWVPDDEEEGDDPAGPEIPPNPDDPGENEGSGDSGGSVVPGGSGNPGSSTAKDQYDNNRKLNGSRTQGVKTGDANTIAIYVFSAVACLAVISAVAYRKRKAR